MELEIFTTEGLAEGSNSGPVDPMIDALTTRPRIEDSTNKLFQ